MKRTLFALITASVLTIVTVPSCSNVAYTPSFGSPSAGTIPDQIIRITERTKYVNVMPFETVRFVVRDASGKESSFDWRFDTYGTPVLPLADIAPRGFLGNRSIEVWIQRLGPQD